MGSSPALARPRVLVVDDEVLIGRVLERTLGQFAEVEVAHSGGEALRKIDALRGAGGASTWSCAT